MKPPDPPRRTRLSKYKKTIKSVVTLCNFVVFILLLSTSLAADYLWPFKEKTYLTGTFGEFRKNHIHAGIDISTHGKIGLPVYAGESGALYRVKTQFIGFGKTVYLKLSDGRFLVYAHLDRFSPKIEKIIETAQLKQQKYEVDIYPKRKLYIKKGELIGYSGDSGGVAPHLHMELRDPKEQPINLLKNGLQAPDKTRPIIKAIAVCNPENTFVISQHPPKKSPHITITGKAGLAVSVDDESHGNNLGVYQLDLAVDGKLFFRVKMDIFSYGEFSDNFLVYNKDLYENNKKIYCHLFRAFNNTLPFYPLSTDGILDLAPGKHSIAIRAIDHQGNADVFEATITAKPGKRLPEKKIETGPWHSEDGRLCVKLDGAYHPVGIQIAPVPPRGWPRGDRLFAVLSPPRRTKDSPGVELENFEIPYNKIKTLPAKPKSEELVPVSKVYDIGPNGAVFKKAIISIKNPFNSKKIALYKLENNKWKYVTDNTCRTLGKFCLFKDSTPPTIQIISPFRAKIEDKGSGLDYDKLALYLDGENIIAEYSVNRKELFYKEKTSSGKHEVTWIAVDRAGNQTKKEMTYNE